MGSIPNFKSGICHCGECPTDTPVLGRKPGKVFMCINTYNKMKSQERDEKHKDKSKVRSLTKVNTGSAYQSSDNKLVNNSAAKQFSLLKMFFDEAAIDIAKHPYCQECGAFIPQIYYHASTAHLLPKREEYGFPSIATKSINRIFLGANCGCHKRYDNSWDDASKMKVWPLAVSIIIRLYPFIDKKEHKNIPAILWVEIEKHYGPRPEF